jgi:hypothetical protein
MILFYMALDQYRQRINGESKWTNRLSKKKINNIILCFCGDITATAAAKIVTVNRKTVNA